MADMAVLNVKIRKEVSKPENKRIQREGYLMGVICGKGMESIPIAVKMDEVRKALKIYGRNSVFTLKDPDNNSYSVMVKNIDLSAKDYSFHHVDFQKVALDEEVKASIAIKFTGLEFLKSKRLLLNRLMDTVAVKGLPQLIPDSIEIDVSNYNAGDTISVRDIKLEEGIEADTELDQLVASINEVRVSEDNEAEDEVAVTI